MTEAVSVEDVSLSPLLVRPAEAARLLAISRSQLYAMVARGQIPACRVGSEIRVSIGALRHWIATHERTVHS